MIPLPGEKIILRGRSARGDDIPLTYDDVEIRESHEVDEPILADQWAELKSVVEQNPKTPAPATPSDDHEVAAAPVFDLGKEEIASPESGQSLKDPEVIEQPVEVSSQWYEVIKGDTLYGISRKFGVSVDSIRHHNQLISDQVNIGQKLRIVK